MNRILIAITSLALWTFATFWVGWEWRDRSADIKKLRADLELAARRRQRRWRRASDRS